MYTSVGAEIYYEWFSKHGAIETWQGNIFTYTHITMAMQSTVWGRDAWMGGDLSLCYG